MGERFNEEWYNFIKMSLQQVLNSKKSGVAVYRISALLPPSAGYRLAEGIARWLSTRTHLPMVKAIRLNQWVLHRCQLSPKELDDAVFRVLRQIALSFYDLFHDLSAPQRLQAKVHYTPEAEVLIGNSIKGGFGVVVAGIHCCGFDYVLHAASLRGLKGLALSLPNPNQAVEWQHQLRQKSGVEVLPASVKNLRLTIERLKKGEVVMTGVDRPLEEVKLEPIFFGYPAHLPVHYVQLALKAEVPVVIMTGIRSQEGTYQVLSSEYMSLKKSGDHRKDILENVRHILAITENILSQYPDQWAIHQPVWPQLFSEVPN